MYDFKAQDRAVSTRDHLNIPAGTTVTVIEHDRDGGAVLVEAPCTTGYRRHWFPPSALEPSHEFGIELRSKGDLVARMEALRDPIFKTEDKRWEAELTKFFNDQSFVLLHEPSDGSNPISIEACIALIAAAADHIRRQGQPNAGELILLAIIALRSRLYPSQLGTGKRSGEK